MMHVKKIGKKAVHRIILYGVMVLLALLSLILFGIYGHLAGLLDAQKEAQRFKGDTKQQFAQVSVFFTSGKEASLDDVGSFRTALVGKYKDLSIESDGTNSIYTDAWSGWTSVSAEGDTGKADVTALCVGGDFFSFHPLELLSGSYFNLNDVMDDYVVLDEGLAWRLFGGTDLAGMTMTIDGLPYVIAGVVQRETDFASEKAYSGGDSLFMSYSKVASYSDAKITTYEIAGQDPVKNFIMGTATNSFPKGVAVSNSDRFSYSSIFNVMKNLPARQMQTEAIAYPYWENAARYIEGLLWPLLLIGTICVIPPAVTAFVLVIHYGRFGIRKLMEFISDQTDKHRMKKYQGKHQG